jgi:hypothetical protein
LEKYSENNRWEKVPRHERFQLTKPEAQVWLALYNLLMEPECRRKYEFSSYNKNEILKLRGSLNGEIRALAIFFSRQRHFWPTPHPLCNAPAT